MGLSFDNDIPEFYQFTLGGPLRLGAFDVDQFRGDNSLLAQLGYLRTIGRLPNFVGGPVYAVGLFEMGSAYERLEEARFRSSFTGGLLLESFLGPLFAGASIGDDGSFKFYFSLGRFVR